MVKVNGPMLSFDASGTIAKTATFSKWKGRNYVRQRVIPANPKSDLQVSVRAALKFLAQAWAGVDSTPKGSWSDLADASQISNFNAYSRKNLQRWREFQAPSQTYPAAETGNQPVATLASAIGGAAHIDLTFTVTTLNDVWGVMIFRSPTGTFDTSRANCIAILEVDSTGTLTYTDSDLPAGTYYYDARFFTKEGALGDEQGEVSATAT
ncbi:MAG: hypothetical protein PHS77_11405 [Gallionellaceae bacterium]|nr:hypothetical protein [Gallionellaceae bacterium]